MKYVVDSNVALKWVLPEIDSAKALKLRADAQAGIHELLAPDIFPIEVAHALTRAERKAIIPAGDADVHLLNILSTSPNFFAYLPLLQQAVAISSAARIGVYDCLYVALADREQCQFVTGDDKLIKALQPSYPFIVSLASIP